MKLSPSDVLRLRGLGVSASEAADLIGSQPLPAGHPAQSVARSQNRRAAISKEVKAAVEGLQAVDDCYGGVYLYLVAQINEARAQREGMRLSCAALARRCVEADRTANAWKFTAIGISAVSVVAGIAAILLS